MLQGELHLHGMHMVGSDQQGLLTGAALNVPNAGLHLFDPKMVWGRGGLCAEGDNPSGVWDVAHAAKADPGRNARLLRLFPFFYCRGMRSSCMPGSWKDHKRRCEYMRLAVATVRCKSSHCVPSNFYRSVCACVYHLTRTCVWCLLCCCPRHAHARILRARCKSWFLLLTMFNYV